MSARITVAYSDGYLRWRLGKGHPTNPVRAQLAVELLRAEVPDGLYREVTPALPERAWPSAMAELERVHARAYLDELASGVSAQWGGQRPDLGRTALLMWEGTRVLVDELLESRAAGLDPAVWFNPQGAKHHAAAGEARGFCALNDMAWAAVTLAAAGLRVAYVDWDAHHGDGVEDLLEDRPELLTCSIHEGGIYPGTGLEHRPDAGALNWALDEDAGDAELHQALRQALHHVADLRPDVVLLAAGADGLELDPLSSLRYTQAGLARAGRAVGLLCRDLGADLLVGGAGGYLPRDGTPGAWAATVLAAAQAMR